MRIGVRVVRGVDWKWAEQDGGEGFVGTVVDLPVTAPKTAQVQWDVKSAMNYRAGYCNQYDLRVFDSAPSGKMNSTALVFGLSLAFLQVLNILFLVMASATIKRFLV